MVYHYTEGVLINVKLPMMYVHIVTMKLQFEIFIGRIKCTL